MPTGVGVPFFLVALNNGVICHLTTSAVVMLLQ